MRSLSKATRLKKRRGPVGRSHGVKSIQALGEFLFTSSVDLVSGKIKHN